MKKLNVSQMENLQGSSNRRCLIAGIFTGIGIGLGLSVAGPAGGAAGLLTGLYHANSQGCFD
ncbi:hypothetical protein [Chryseobacterium indoltheticum]|uniref:Uncharacterized protein n=1 Tax=Chryseobacterium indoltheticum TaxID=254 RepID=A0A381FNK6_9FLAO|nr:hypothetical protein [Chryseobacterium indoltheticum]SUX47782.1 Uncharacterised protein [Chryseobacterium indoltheticum]